MIIVDIWWWWYSIEKRRNFQMHSEQVRHAIVKKSKDDSFVYLNAHREIKNGQVYRLKTMRFFSSSSFFRWKMKITEWFYIQSRANAIAIIHRVNIFIHLNTYAIFYFRTDATILFCVVLVWTTHSTMNNRLYALFFFQLWISLLIKLFTHKRQPICHIPTVLSFRVLFNRLLHL